MDAKTTPLEQVYGRMRVFVAQYTAISSAICTTSGPQTVRQIGGGLPSGSSPTVQYLRTCDGIRLY